MLQRTLPGAIPLSLSQLTGCYGNKSPKLWLIGGNYESLKLFPDSGF